MGCTQRAVLEKVGEMGQALIMALKLMNNFPEQLVAQVPEDHRKLRDTFDFTPTTLEMEAHRRMGTTH